MAAAKEKSPREVLAALRADEQSERGRATVGTINDFDLTIRGYSTGNLALDFLTDVGGFPVGRIVECFGEPSSGKSTSSFQALALEQQRIIRAKTEEYVMFLDFEHSIDPQYVRNLGVDTEHESFIYVRPENFEHGASIYRKMLNTTALRIGVFDSVAAMVTEKEQNADTGAATVADRAKMLHQFCRQIAGPADKFASTPIFLNHTMELVDLTFMGQQIAARGIKRYTQPGGKALPFWASMRIEFKKGSQVKARAFDPLVNDNDDKTVTGQSIVATVVKNKAGLPFRTADLRVRRGLGFSQPYSVHSVLLSRGVVKKSGAFYTYPADIAGGTARTFQGEEKVLLALESEPALLLSAEAKARAILMEYGLPQIAGAADLYDSEGNLKPAAEIVIPNGGGATVHPTTGEVSGSITWEDPEGEE